MSYGLTLYACLDPFAGCIECRECNDRGILYLLCNAPNSRTAILCHAVGDDPLRRLDSVAGLLLPHACCEVGPPRTLIRAVLHRGSRACSGGPALQIARETESGREYPVKYPYWPVVFQRYGECASHKSNFRTDGAFFVASSCSRRWSAWFAAARRVPVPVPHCRNAARPKIRRTASQALPRAHICNGSLRGCLGTCQHDACSDTKRRSFDKVSFFFIF